MLVVEDDPLVRTLYDSVLGAEPGVRLVIAPDGEEGLLRALELGPALVLADLLMPRVDGATFSRVLRAHPATAATPIVAVSGVDPDAERARALRAHCAAWLSKPFEVDELLRVVRRWLSPAPPARSEGARAWGPLTPREREVAALVARGLTNAGIAEALVLQAGSVANHVRRILLKLGLESRTQLAVWVATDTSRRASAGLG